MNGFLPSRRIRLWFFGIFFVVTTTQCIPIRTQGSLFKERLNGSSPEQLLNWAEQENQRNPEDPEPYLIRAEAAFELAKSTTDIAGRNVWYSELRLAIDEFEQIFDNGSDRLTVERDSIVTRAWRFEFGQAQRLLTNRDETLQNPSFGDLGSAVAHLENAFLILPDSLQSREWLATLTYQNGDAIRALNLLEEGHDSHTTLPSSYLEKLAWLYLETGNITAALSVYEELNRPGTVTKRHRVAYVNALHLSGDRQLAIDYLITLADDFPNDPDLKKALLLEALYRLDEVLLAESAVSSEKDDIKSLFSESSRLVEKISEVASDRAIWWSSGKTTIEAPSLFPVQRTDIHSFIEDVSDLFFDIFIKLDQAEQLSTEEGRLVIRDLESSLKKSALPLLEQLFEYQPDSADLAEKLYRLYVELGLTNEAESLQKKRSSANTKNL